VNFKNVILIMTSNLGSEYLSNPDLSEEEREVKVLETIRGFFRPEFLNRLDSIVQFHSLSHEHLERIARIQIDRLIEKIKARGINLKVDDKVRDLIIEQGFDAEYGARPMRRAIENLLLNPLAVQLLNGDFESGTTIQAKRSGTGIEFV